MKKLIDNLVSSEQIVEIVKLIEDKLPGYWYSVYQTVREEYEVNEPTLIISGGPALSCPRNVDRLWAKTKEGDAGFSIKIPLSHTDIVVEFEEWVEQLLQSVELSVRSYNDVIPLSTEVVRVQSSIDLEELKINYNDSLSILKKTDNIGFILKELHIGSCSLTADSSVRGMFNSEYVDIMNDIYVGSLGNSLWLSVVELLMLTSGKQSVSSGTTADAPYSFGSDNHPGFAKIVEESGELLEIIGKILMVGGNLHHWTGDLRQPLQHELADVSAAIDFYIAQPENMTVEERKAFFERKMSKLAKFEGWQSEPDVLP